MKFKISSLMILLVMIACLEPPHDHPYDAKNPDKADLQGVLYNIAGRKMEGAKVTLLQDGMMDEAITTGDGSYAFWDVDPGFYIVEGRAPHHYPETLAVLLEAATLTTQDIYCNEAFFNFEDESVNTVEPAGFTVETGFWRVGTDAQHGHVYNGNTDSLGHLAMALVDAVLNDFYYEVLLKVNPSTVAGYWQVGTVFRYQGPDNHYGIMIFPDHIKIYRIVNSVFDVISEDWRDFDVDKWYLIGVDCQGSHIDLCLNQNLILQGNDSSFLSGRIGIFAEGEGQFTSVGCDNIYIDVEKQ